jgi:SAM-dependent methyltransferase
MSETSLKGVRIKLPPQTFRERISSASARDEYLLAGVRSASTIFHVLKSSGYDLGSFENILDFACGCGRTLNFIRRYVAPEKLYGCDYDPELVAWCERNLDVRESVVNKASPPTPFPNSHFDFIYSIAFFNNLDECTQEKWLLEWARILKNDGLILLSLCGPKLAQCRKISIPSRGFIREARVVGLNNSTSYQTCEYIEREWSEFFRILDFQELGLLHNHDLVLLSKRESSIRTKTLLPLRFPYELIQEYEHRSDLKFVFDEHGLGRPDRGWQNLSLWDWALTNGGHDVPSLSHLRFTAVYDVVESL